MKMYRDKVLALAEQIYVRELTLPHLSRGEDLAVGALARAELFYKVYQEKYPEIKEKQDE